MRAAATASATPTATATEIETAHARTQPGTVKQVGGAGLASHGQYLQPRVTGVAAAQCVALHARDARATMQATIGAYMVPGVLSDTAVMSERNVLGGELEPCGDDPVTGFYRDGCCNTGPEDIGSHTICAVVTAEFLNHQREIGNDLITPMPQFRFPGLTPGDRWCVTAVNWLRAHRDGAAAYVVLASTHERALEIVPIEALRERAIDVPASPGSLGD